MVWIQQCAAHLESGTEMLWLSERSVSVEFTEGLFLNMCWTKVGRNKSGSYCPFFEIVGASRGTEWNCQEIQSPDKEIKHYSKLWAWSRLMENTRVDCVLWLKISGLRTKNRWETKWASASNIHEW